MAATHGVSPTKGRVLLVDDEPDICELLGAELERRGFHVSSTSHPAEAAALLQREPVDVLLSDIRMPELSGLDLCQRVSASRPDIPVVLVTAFANLESAVDALRAGAFDYVTKPFALDELTKVLERAVQQAQLSNLLRRLETEPLRTPTHPALLGESPAMRELLTTIRRVAETDAAVLIAGESGTGKELIAAALHDLSKRRSGPFVAVNCAAMPENLLESELFGHTKGAFTDAYAHRKGLFLKAQGGTLFLDEIGELPLSLQPKLLRVLEEGSIRPVGGDETVDVDVRVVAATNRNLERAVAEQRFREDLFFRINVIPITAPPLRARGDDVLLLAQYFLKEAAAQHGKEVIGFTNAVAERLRCYDWPGNVRELRNAIEHAVALTSLSRLVLEDLPERIREAAVRSGGSNAEGNYLPMSEVERRYILEVLAALGGNKAQAAKVLGLDRKTLYRKLARWGGGGENDGAN